MCDAGRAVRTMSGHLSVVRDIAVDQTSDSLASQITDALILLCVRLSVWFSGRYCSIVGYGHRHMYSGPPFAIWRLGSHRPHSVVHRTIVYSLCGRNCSAIFLVIVEQLPGDSFLRLPSLLALLTNRKMFDGCNRDFELDALTVLNLY